MKRSKQTPAISNAVVAIELFLIITASLVLVDPVQHRIFAQEVEHSGSATSVTTQTLPSGEEVMAKHVAQTGGQDAYDSIENRVSEATLEIVGQGVSLNLQTYSARPNKTLLKIDSNLTGKIEKGCDGKVVWENSLVNGPIIADGAQRTMGLRDSTFERFVYWKTIYGSAECASLTKVGDFDCYEIVLTPKKTDGSVSDDSPMRLFVDASSYLIRKIHTIVESEAGKIPVVAFPEDYRNVDGILVSHKVRVELLGQKREVTVNSIKHNEDFPETLFDLPDEVRQLITE